MVEELVHHDQTLGSYLFGYLYSGAIPNATTFITPDKCQQQAGYIVYPKDSEIKRHLHNAVERHLHTTTEVLLIIKGSCIVDFYRDKELVLNRSLVAGNVLIIVNGGHGFRVLEDLVLFEVKQGPYTGPSEKVRF